LDNLTHSLFGVMLGRAGPRRLTGLATPALVIGANLPDIDAACVLYGTQSLAMRRGLTHGPIAWAVLPVLLVLALWTFDRWQDRRGTRPPERLPVRFLPLWGLALLACLTHPALDWLNSYGIRLLAPFSQRWFHGDALFIIDVWLWALLAGAWLLSRRREARGRDGAAPARLALLIGLAYIAGNVALSRSMARMDSYEMQVVETIPVPVPFAFWQRDVLMVGPEGRHRVLRGFAGPSETPPRSEVLGDAWLPSCALADLAGTDPALKAFLFWSSAPYVSRDGAGNLMLHDARFSDARTASRFAVALPRSACSEFYAPPGTAIPEIPPPPMSSLPPSTRPSAPPSAPSVNLGR